MNQEIKDKLEQAAETAWEQVQNERLEYLESDNAGLRERVKELETAIAGYKECFEQFVPESKWDEATAFLSSYRSGLAKDFQRKENQ